jgi:IclR family KDG regulon transcriptional repressor
MRKFKYWDDVPINGITKLDNDKSKEIARKIGFSSSTTGRLLQAMKETGLLRQNQDLRTYSLGGKVLTWAGVYMSTLDIRRKAFPAMQRLHRDTQETISLYIQEGIDRVCVERLESTRSVRIVAQLGKRLPLYAGSAGKVFLAYLPPEKRDQILSMTQLKPLTPATIVNPHILHKELEKIKKMGYSVSHGEWIPEASGVSAPIFDLNGEITAAVTISGPGQRFTEENVNKFVDEIVRVAQEISQDLGYTGEHSQNRYQPDDSMN